MKIRYVDSFKIRNEFDMDFGLIHKRDISGFAPTWYIPAREIWIEKRLKNEADFLIKTMKLEESLCRKISDFKKIRKVLAEKLCAKSRPKIDKITRKKYQKYDFLIRELDGGAVRKYFDPLFIIGGHNKTYSYVPKGEVWVDAKMDPKELKYNLIHESLEYALMLKKINYDVSHEYATAAEKEARRKDGIRFRGDEEKFGPKMFFPEILKIIRK